MFIRNNCRLCVRQDVISWRRATTMSSMIKMSMKPEGDISSVFASLSGEIANKPLEPRFAQLKADIVKNNEDKIQNSWYRLLDALKHENAKVRSSGRSFIPEIHFDDMKNVSVNVKNKIRRSGVMIVRNVLSPNDALSLKVDVQDYIRKNPNTNAFPKERPVVYELYWSTAQIRARANSRVVDVLKFANSFWHASPSTRISLAENVVYADRLRIRPPGDDQFALGSHVDGGSIERWEDPEYRSCYSPIFEGCWEENDFFDATHRVKANMSLYNTIGGCSVFRTWQGWLSVSTVNPGEGGLLVNPLLQLATSYWLLRPFFIYNKTYAQWDTDRSSIWQGAIPGRGQEINDTLHPELELATTMVPIPTVHPGDMVFWHCDTIHAVDAIHRGVTDSSVFYIPAVPLCEMNVNYLVQQREAFQQGIAPPDFPGGEGESKHFRRATLDDIIKYGGEHSMGFKPFNRKTNMTPGETDLISITNKMLNL